MKHCKMLQAENMDRREFCKKSLVLGAAVYGASLFDWTTPLHAQAAPGTIPDLVAVRNGEPDVMFDQAIAAIGGIEQVVKSGQIVVVKPNIGWNREPETGANTHPLLVKRIVEHCVNAGAKKVYVFDNSVSSRQGPKCYQRSGIEDAATAAGAVMVPAHNKKYFGEITIPGARKLEKTMVHELIPEADVLINVPVLKHHSGSQLTIAMKNLMGVVWDRGAYHRKGLHHCIADFCLYRKPDLNVVDAYQVTMRNGPNRARKEDLELKKALLLSRDIVAVDTAAAKVFGIEPERVRHIGYGQEHQLGTMNLESLQIERIVL
jgi:uncharacterized protein (DUF362 family)